MISATGLQGIANAASIRLSPDCLSTGVVLVAGACEASQQVQDTGRGLPATLHSGCELLKSNGLNSASGRRPDRGAPIG